MSLLSEANDPELKSWVDVPPRSDFPIQNLPFGIFARDGSEPCAGVAIGGHIVNLAWLQEHEFFSEAKLPDGIFRQPTLNDFLALGKERIRHVRALVSRLLRHDSHARDEIREHALTPQERADLLRPVDVRNYTDFYSSEEHAFNVGSMFRDPANALMPNWKHLPVGYHGRASSIVVSGTGIRRPWGQVKSPDKPRPELTSTRKLDFELELGFITCAENRLGHPVGIGEAERYIAGMVLFNDWSARDIQQWEYVPLGPFLGKSFASTMSPWIVTLDALEPFRVEGPLQDPEVLPYLQLKGKRNFDIILEVSLMVEGGWETVLCRSNSKYLYWNIDQQLAHQTINGCNVQPGDLYASGTISGPSPGSFGSLLELTWNGGRPLAMPDGTTRTFLEDGDTVIMRAYAENRGVRIGFGTCSGKIFSAAKLS